VTDISADHTTLNPNIDKVPSIKSGGSALHTAAVTGDVKAVQEHLSNSTALTVVNEEKADGMTPLITASMMGHTEVVKVLLDENADVEATGTNGATALMIAASMGHLEVMQALLNYGAHVDAGALGWHA
jgi:ankyrin repeat protein